ncbi:MAG: peptide chain release factor H [Pseudomonadota bacterium]
MKAEQKTRLLITSGDRPEECRIAVSRILRVMEKEAASNGVHCEFAVHDDRRRHGPSSAVASLSGKHAIDFSRRWHGTIQWICRSPVRPHHRRRNWFVGIFRIESNIDQEIELQPSDLRFEKFRAGGPGGQHQNTTDSAVRVTHIPTGISAISRDQRSQHRNKQVAVERLGDQLAARRALQQATAQSTQNQLHKNLERGNPLRVFTGEKFTEKTGSDM